MYVSRLTLLLTVALLSVFSSRSIAADRRPPNILFILADDENLKTVGCYPGSWPWVKTPNIDALAAGGVRFQGAYLGSWCMPSRAALLTGHWPHGVESMRLSGKYPDSTYDPQQCPFWPGVFRQHGYQTAQIGKWHTGEDAGWGRDWDYQMVWNRPKHPENAGAYYKAEIIATNGVEEKVEGYPADNYNKWACDYIRGAHRDPQKPWYLWLCYGNIHGPSIPPERHKGLYKDAAVPEPKDILPPRPGKPDYLNKTQAWARAADGQIIAAKGGEKVGDDAGKSGKGFADWVRQVNECMPVVDEGVGQLIAALRETGQLENTLVVYSADQGFAMGEHGCRMKVAPYDANYRSPFIVSMPGVVAAGKVCPQVVSSVDLVTTFFAFAGLEQPWKFHGRDITPLLRDPAAAWPYPCLYEHTGESYGSDVTKVLSNKPQKAEHQNVPWYDAIVLDGWKYIRYLRAGEIEELYDLRKDPEELTNLAAAPEQRERLEKLRATLLAELHRTDAAYADTLGLTPSGK
ncbi:MAG: sulfatase-like hydrolase/transferase [Chthoniobacter sp.]|uniref:sulfatase-like hydrolase/transferase n=1 Tax=Chthoniobacter sp. TaxID=2510640 RepID=UPI0032A22F3E